MAIGQVQRDCPRQGPLPAQTRRREGRKVALRCLRRRLSEVVYRRPPREAKQRGRRARQDYRGDYTLQRGRLNPHHRNVGHVTSGTANTAWWLETGETVFV